MPNKVKMLNLKILRGRKSLFMIYDDFESTLMQEKYFKNVSDTNKYQNYVPYSYGYKVACVKREPHSNYIFPHFALIGLECDSITLFTKMNFFSLPKLIFQHHLNKIYMVFYLLT